MTSLTRNTIDYNEISQDVQNIIRNMTIKQYYAIHQQANYLANNLSPEKLIFRLKKPNAIEHIVTAMALIIQGELSVAALVEALKTRQWLWFTPEEILVEIGSPAVTPLLQELRHNTDCASRCIIACILGYIGDAQAIETLRTILAIADQVLTAIVADALLRILNAQTPGLIPQPSYARHKVPIPLENDRRIPNVRLPLAQPTFV